jgi:hypothetical protein
MRVFTAQIRRDQRALCSASRLTAALFPTSRARSAAQKARSSRAAIQMAASAAGFHLRSAAALRSGFVPAVSPPALHFPRSPPADRSLVKIEERQSHSRAIRAVGLL